SGDDWGPADTARQRDVVRPGSRDGGAVSRRGLRIYLATAAVALAAGPARAQPPGYPAADLPAWARTTQTPLPGSPLPSDGLMAPAPPVPPRSAYQLPGRPPAGPPAAPEPPDLTLPEGAAIPVPDGRLQTFRLTPRYGRTYNTRSELLDDKVTRRTVITGGLILNATLGGG